MNHYQVSAKGTLFGTYQSDSPQHACDLCAQDAGFRDVADMVDQTEEPCELIAVELPPGGTDRDTARPAYN